MLTVIRRYADWLHLRWPAGEVEKLPLSNEDGSTNVPGLYIVGDLRGTPLLKFSADSGARAVKTILNDRSFRKNTSASASKEEEVLDLVIIGAGVSGMAAALEALKAGLSFKIIEATRPFSTIVDFPKGKPIYTYPKEMTPAGDLQFTADVKEALVDELIEQTLAKGITPIKGKAERVLSRGGHLEVIMENTEPIKARSVIAALGRSGNYRKLGIPGEELDKVHNRLHDPQDFCDQDVLVVGGGDSALETAIALASCGARVTVSYRKEEFSRAKPQNTAKLAELAAGSKAESAEAKERTVKNKPAIDGFIPPPEKPGSIELMMGSLVEEIKENEVIIRTGDGELHSLRNDVVFTMIGREAPLDFFRQSGVRIAGEWTRGKISSFAAFFLFSFALYNWKSGGALSNWSSLHGWFPFSLMDSFASAAANPGTLLGTLVISASTPPFWYTLAYSILVTTFGVRRMRRRKTPYITAQTLALTLIQVLPLFLLPEIILPLLGHNNLLPSWLTNALFPPVSYGHGYEFWRAYGLILAWPLNVYNVFTNQPLGWWLTIAFFQTFVIIPLLIYFFGKGAYCSWICSCGALAETLGDGQRHKMPHGPAWNRINLIGQVILAIAFAMLAIRIIGWLQPDDASINRFFERRLNDYKWGIDVFLAGVVGYGAYFWLSGRVWCRFFCPLAALMHIYTRFTRFRIISDKKKCISCNLCTGICHMGIDIMNFANKGIPLEDPECVRCSACIHICPTGVLTFGMVNKKGEVILTDRLAASHVHIADTRS